MAYKSGQRGVTGGAGVGVLSAGVGVGVGVVSPPLVGVISGNVVG